MLRMKAIELKKKLLENEVTTGRLCEILEVSRSTLWRKINNGRGFYDYELSLIRKSLNLNDSEFINIFFNN